MFILKRMTEKGDYRMFSCDSYRVERDNTGETVVRLFHGEDEFTRFFVTGAILYVMNEHGKTIDTIDRRVCQWGVEQTGSVTVSGVATSGDAAEERD